MSDKISRVKINELPSSESIHDEDTFIESSDSETYKTSADDIAKYVSENKHMTEKYVQSDRIGESDGVAPLNSEKKLNGSYVTYGTVSNTAYEGSSGKVLEQRLEAEKSRAISAETSAYQQAAEYTDQKFADLKTVAFTGSYSDLSDQPAIPTKTSQLTNDSGYKTTDTKYTHPTTSGNKHIPSGGSSGQILRWSADGTAVWGADNNTTYNAATTSANGLMSATDKTKLNGIAAGATANAPSETTPKAAGTAAVGTEETFARGDHVHPAQTSVSGNAGTATKLATARTIDGVSFDGSAAITHYGTCSTAAATAAKTVACTGFTLVTGAEITVKFTVTNAATNPTLNVNGTGAKPIYYRGAALVIASYLKKNSTYTFRYNGTQYELVGDIAQTVDFNVGGDKSLYYPVLINMAGFGWYHINIYRGYSETAPTDWGTNSSHRGGLTLCIRCTGDTSWGGNDHRVVVDEFSETYCHMVGNLVMSTSGLLVWLRGGGAIYHISSDTYTKATVYLDGFTANDDSVFNPMSYDAQIVADNVTAKWKDRHGTYNGNITGNAETATKLATARTIDGVSFNGTAAITHYGTCSTAAGTAAKVVACTGFTLVTGASVRVKFTVTNTAASPTLNVNSTGAKAVYYRGSAIKAGFLAANRTYEFVYNGAQYDLVGDNISDLETDMVSLKKSVSDGKSAVASAITAQGVTTAADAAYSTMASNITTLSANRYQAGSDAAKVGTAAAANVLTGKTFTNTSSVGATGTMPNNGAVSKTFTPSASVQSYTVPAGYHNGSGTVTCNAISTETKTFKPTTNSTSHRVTPSSGKYLTKVTVDTSSVYTLGYNAGVSAGGSGKYMVKAGSYAYTPSGSGWYRPAIDTGLSTVNGFLLSARRSDGGDGGSGCFLTEYTASGGTVTAAVYLARLNYTISWIAYGS